MSLPSSQHAQNQCDPQRSLTISRSADARSASSNGITVFNSLTSRKGSDAQPLTIVKHADSDLDCTASSTDTMLSNNFPTSTTVVTTSTRAASSEVTTTIATTTAAPTNPTMALSAYPPIPLAAYISLSQIAISSALKVAMVSTSMSLGVARTIVSGIDKILGIVVNGVTGQSDERSQGLSPAFVASLPFRAALLGINFSDILVQTILETVDGSVNLALATVQDGLDLMDTLFGPDSTSQTGETFREVWAILNREFSQMNGGQGSGGYPALEGMRLFMAYIAIQFATSEKWEAIRVRAQGRLVGECLESRDEDLGSSTAWSATAAWPEEWTKGGRGLAADELLEEQRVLELREQREGRTAASFSAYASGASMASGSGSRPPNPELTNFLAASYRFSRFCSAMYGSLALEFMGAPERYPPPPIPVTTAPSAPPPVATNASDHHFYCYTGTPLGSILYSSDTPATIQDGYYSPRYYLLDDVETKQIVLVLRGTKSLHDLMIDLTCDTADLWLHHDTTPLVDAQGNTFAYDADLNDGAHQRKRRPFKVHGGFLRAARTIASADTIGIQEKVKAALESRPDYSLLLIGHSLGAGIASILSMLWADPATGFTPEIPRHTSERRSSSGADTPPVAPGLTSGLGLGSDEGRERLYLPGYLPRDNVESFLPPGRRVRCYAYGIPKVTCPRMAKRAIKLVTSISYGDDVVGRLSLGSVRNIWHAMGALQAMRPPPPPSPPASPSPPSSPNMDATSTEAEVFHDSSETLDDLLEAEGEGVDCASPEKEEEDENEEETSSGHRSSKRSHRRRRHHHHHHHRKNKEKKDQRQEKEKKPEEKSIGLEIVQKVIRWKLTGEERLLEEFMDIRRAMQREMERHQERYDGSDFYPENSEPKIFDINKTSPVLVPPGKVLWIRPTSAEKELEDAEMKQHPLESVIHQFEWDHPIEHDPASLLIPNSISEYMQHRNSAESVGIQTTLATTTTTTPATTTFPTMLHASSQNTEKLLYRMYAVPEPEYVFDEMLFSRRMWSDHLPLTYEFILAGKHAIPVTSPEAQKEKDRILAASARGSVAV